MAKPTPPLEPDRFEDAVPHYIEHRVRYADRLIERVAEAASLTPSSKVMDLGCGPGFIANRIAAFAGDVVGVDPNERMLEAARQEAVAMGVDNVVYLVGSSFDLSIVDGPLQLVTMGRSFHWMDRTATLAALNGLVASDGVVALLWDQKPEAPENAWWETFKDVCREFEAKDDFWKERRSKDWEPHVSILMRSAFADVTHLGFYEHRQWTVEDLIGLALSQSGTTSGRLGDKMAAFEQAVRDALTPLADEGTLTGLVEHSATLGRRR
jgi:SAM-dependent methyltransferase